MPAPFDPADNRSRTVPTHLTLTVGREEGDLRGADDKALQAGLDYLHRLGGGTLHILPGEYLLRNALYLRPGVHLRGAGDSTVLRKAPGFCTPLRCDADWYEARIRVEDPSGFSPGCGVMLRSTRRGTMEVIKDTVVAVEGDTLSLSRRLEKNAWLEDGATAATIFPLLTAEWVADVLVEDLVLDGDRAHNEEINGNYAGAVFIQHCDRFTFRRVTARCYHGDGFSFQVCDDVRFEACRAEDNANLGFHPGSGSQRPVFTDCIARRNNQGIFFCWGVTHGLAENCLLADNRHYGSSIGHRDTDNRLVGCTFEGNEKVGLLFRASESEYRGAHRNQVELCTFRDNGFGERGAAVEFRGAAYEVVLRQNCFEDSGAGKQRIGVLLGAGARGVELTANRFSGLAQDVVRTEAESLAAS